MHILPLPHFPVSAFLLALGNRFANVWCSEDWTAEIDAKQVLNVSFPPAFPRPAPPLHEVSQHVFPLKNSPASS